MSSGQFTNTSSHMVQEVTNIIDGYKMGSIRALAQEPVQNALDAMRQGEGKVTVEYRLIRRQTSANRPCYLLAVTDSGTTGLRGPIVSDEELTARQFKLTPEENWAAFEAQGYTKENEDALGSRGQGKAAFLYHSHVPGETRRGETRRMVMLYDTLLEDGEYRLGLRFARPVDQILTPPLYNDEAKKAIQSATYPLEDRLQIPLGLEPLQETGTRVIVPFFSDDDAKFVRPGGELCNWLQRCWWRAIQTGKLSIRVVEDETGKDEVITAPSWWQDFPRQKDKHSSAGSWIDLPDGGRACIWGDMTFGDGHRIRRLVILHSDDLHEDEIVRDQPEYAGIQVLRGSQWIETRGARQDFGDYIPLDKRPGFRGFVEFDKHTDSMLRAAENSQHDGFDARGKKGEIVRELRDQLDSCTSEFSETMGWAMSQAVSKQQVSQREKSTHARFMETFLNPNGHKPNPPSPNGPDDSDEPQLLWDCRLDLEYPDPKSARVDWGQSICNVHVEVGVEPSEDLVSSADLVLEWVDAAGKALEICRREDAISKQWGKDRAQEQFELGDWQILRGKANREGLIECPEPGECRMRAAVEHRSERVTSAARIVYVQAEPPPPPEKNPVTLSISAENISTSKQQRINHGQVLQIQINARNRRPEADTYYLTATFEEEVFAREMSAELVGTPAGGTAGRQAILTEKRQLLDPQQAAPLKIDGIQQQRMPDSSGVYRVRAELTDAHGESIAVATRQIYFERDPGKAKDNLPFEIGQKSQKAMWVLNTEGTKLTYPRDYPLYKELPVLRRQHRALQANLAFIAEISANGLLEWALRPKIENGDDSNYDQLYDESRSHDMWDTFNRGLENLSKTAESPTQFAKTWRETVAVMLDIFAKEND